MKWFRFYHEFVDDPKIAMMSDSDQLLWVKALCLASESKERGFIQLSDEEVCWKLRVTMEVWKHAIDKFRAKGMIEHSEKGYKILNWDKRQFCSDSSAERVAKHRKTKPQAKKKSCNVTSPLLKRSSNNSVTPPDTDTDTDIREQIQTQISEENSLNQEFIGGCSETDKQPVVANATDDRAPVEPFQFEQPRWTAPQNSQTAKQPNGQNPLPVQSECSSPPENKQSRGRGKNSAAAENPLFVEFWKVFPRKVGKPQAEKAFVKVPAEVAVQLPAILEQQKAEYRAHHPGTTDWRYFPHPTTYLNQQRWESQEEAIAPTTTEFSPEFLYFLASSWIPSLPGYNGANQNIHQAKDWCIRAGSQRVEVAHEAWRDRCQREAALSQPSSVADIQPATPEARLNATASIRSLLGEKRHAV